MKRVWCSRTDLHVTVVFSTVEDRIDCAQNLLLIDYLAIVTEPDFNLYFSKSASCIYNNLLSLSILDWVAR